MKMNLRELFLVAALLLPTVPVQASGVDFNTHPADFGNPIFDSGFTFNTSAEGWGVFNGSGEACCNINGNPDGTRSLFADGGNASTVMSLTGGGAFDVFGFDGASYWFGASGTLNVIGNYLAGGSISSSFAVGSQWQTFALTGYTGLVSLTFQDSQSGSFLVAPGFGVDNIQLVAAIPEPETYAMLLAGLGLLGFAARRRKLKEAAVA